MKLSYFLYAALLFFNLGSLYITIDQYIYDGRYELLGYGQGRAAFYMTYVNILLNLYFLCYTAMKKRFEE